VKQHQAAADQPAPPQNQGKRDVRAALATAAPKERLAQLTTYLQGEVAQLLRLPEPPSPRQGFFDLGLDSLMTVDLKKRLETTWAISLPATVMYTHPTIERLAQYMAQHVPAWQVKAEECPPRPEARPGLKA
jgi:acyl carrier protein